MEGKGRLMTKRKGKEEGRGWVVRKERGRKGRGGDDGERKGKW